MKIYNACALEKVMCEHETQECYSTKAVSRMANRNHEGIDRDNARFSIHRNQLTKTAMRASGLSLFDVAKPLLLFWKCA